MNKGDKAILIVVAVSATALLAACAWSLGVMFTLVSQGATL